MSVEAISWALNLAPVPAGRSGQPSSACKFVLVGLANHAGPDGGGAFPAVRTLMRYTGLSERTVRYCLGRLEAAGLIRPCDPAVVAARIKRADRRPKGWDLDLTRTDLTEEEETALLEGLLPGPAARLAAPARHGGSRTGNGVRPPHPAPGTGRAVSVDNPAGGVQGAQPVPGAGCSRRPDGVQRAQPRGAAGAPEPYRNPSREPSAATQTRKRPPETASAGGGQAAEFFGALGPLWRLTPAQRTRLTPAVLTALTAGWAPHTLAGFTGANTGGVRNPYAVLTSRLSPAELPPPPGRRPARPPWCGECDQATRMLGFHGDSPRPCPQCKPASSAQRDSAGPGRSHGLCAGTGIDARRAGGEGSNCDTAGRLGV